MSERMTPAEIVLTLRREGWLNHGHDYHALYGDDGEIQCVQCPADFKRQPLEDLRRIVLVRRAEAARDASNVETKPKEDR